MIYIYICDIYIWSMYIHIYISTVSKKSMFSWQHRLFRLAWPCTSKSWNRSRWRRNPIGWIKEKCGINDQKCIKMPYGYGSIPIDTFLVGWTSIYQLFWGSLGTRVLTHPHMFTNQRWSFNQKLLHCLIFKIRTKCLIFPYLDTWFPAFWDTGVPTSAEPRDGDPRHCGDVDEHHTRALGFLADSLAFWRWRKWDKRITC